MQAYFYFHNAKHAKACGVKRVIPLDEAMSLLKKETDNRPDDIPFLNGVILYADNIDKAMEYVTRQ